MGCMHLMRAYRGHQFGGHMDHLFDISLKAYPQSEGKDQNLEKQQDLINTNPSN